MNKKESPYRWVVFASVLFAYFAIVSQRTAPGLITVTLMHQFHVTASVIGLMTSIQFFAYAGFQIPVGLLSDRFGPNRFLIVGTLLVGLGTILFSLAPNHYILLISRFLVGAGDATIFVNFVLILGQWFRDRQFVQLLGLVGVAASLGFLMATVPFAAWLSVVNWRQPFLIIGIVICATSLLLYFVLVGRPRRMFPGDVGRAAGSVYQSAAARGDVGQADGTRGDARPGDAEEDGERPGGLQHAGVEEDALRQTLPSDSARSSDRRQAQPTVLATLRRLLSARQAWATFMCHFGLVGTYVGFIGSWGVPYGIQVFGLSRGAASQLMMYGLFGAMIGGPLATVITSRVNRTKTIYIVFHIMTVLSWLGWFLLGGRPPFGWIVALLFLIGLGNGASSLTFVVVRSSFSLSEVGVASGFANMGGFLSAVLLPSLFGAVLDTFPSESVAGYHFGLVIALLFAVVGLGGGLLIREMKGDVAEQAG